MDQLIASYLFQTKNCPLTGIGSLHIIPTATITDFSNKLIYPPTAAIQFDTKEQETAPLINYLSRQSGSSFNDAQQAYESFCSQLKDKATQNGRSVWEGVGQFQVDESGNIHFQQQELPSGFSQPVDAVRVIHPEATHQVLVGDKETTNVAMTEYFSEKPEVKDRWWIWAIALGLIGIGALAYYFIAGHGHFPFGNAVSYEFL